MNSSDELLQEIKPIRPKTLETVTRQLDREVAYLSRKKFGYKANWIKAILNKKREPYSWMGKTNSHSRKWTGRGQQSLSNIEKAISRLLILPFSYISLTCQRWPQCFATSLEVLRCSMAKARYSCQWLVTSEEREPSNIRHWTKLFFLVP